MNPARLSLAFRVDCFFLVAFAACACALAAVFMHASILACRVSSSGGGRLFSVDTEAGDRAIIYFLFFLLCGRSFSVLVGYGRDSYR